MNFDELQSICTLSRDPQDLETYGKDWLSHYPANPSVVVFPETTEQVQQVIQWANRHSVAVVPSGGRTGLSGGATATQQEVLLSLEKMNQILSWKPADFVVHAEAGVVTEALQQFVQEKGYYFPVDFAAKGSSQLGGNAATNVGGVKVLKYGSFRQWVSHLTVVTGAGEILRLNRDLVKNATGYDLKNLFIGSEGTLGIITEVGLKVIPPPQESSVIVVGLEDLEQVLPIYQSFKTELSLSACEFFSDLALEKVIEHNPDFRPPFESKAPYYLLLEVENTGAKFDEQLFSVFEKGMEKGWIMDGVISQSPEQANSLWQLRERISESLSPYSPHKNDVSVAVSRLPEFTKELENVFHQTQPQIEVVFFGHIGDGNIHVNLLKPEELKMDEFVKNCRTSDEALFQLLKKFDGAVSAEHGVGLLKREKLWFSRTKPELKIMRGIKSIFDPNGILNPGKIFNPN